MGLWKRFATAVKRFFSGGGTPKATPPRPIQNPTSRQVVSSNAPSGRWNAGSGTTRRNLLDLFRKDDEEKEKQRNTKSYGDAYKAKTTEYKSLAQSIDKKSGTAASDPKEAARTASRERLKSLVDSAGERESLHKQNLDKLKTKREEKHEAYHAATNHRYDVGEKGISDEERERRKQNIRTATLGEMMWGRDNEAEDMMKARMKYDKIRTSAERGAANTATLGLVNLGQKRLAKGNLKKAEDIYQKNKSKGAEIAGSLAGGLAVYGGTAGGFNDIGAKAVGRAASTEIGKKVGAKKLAELMAGNGAKAALARSLVGDTIQDSTIGAIDTAMDIAARDDLETAGDYAKAFAKGQAANYAMGLAGNAVGQALPVAGKAARNAWDNFADESRKLRVVPKGVTEAGSKLTKNANEAVESAAKETGTVIGNGKKTYTFEVYDGYGKREVVTVKANKASEAADLASDYGLSKGMNWSHNITTGKSATKATAKPAEEVINPNMKRGVASASVDAPEAERAAGYTTEEALKQLDGVNGGIHEVYLGSYGHITENADGTYNLFVNGVGDRTLNRQEAEAFIDDAVRKLNADEERIRVTRTSPLTDAEKARIADIDNEIARLEAEGNADLSQHNAEQKYKGIEGYWDRQGERSQKISELTNEKNRIEIKEPEAGAKQASEPISVEAAAKVEEPIPTTNPQPEAASKGAKPAAENLKSAKESGDIVPTGERAKTGERTEFKRGNEETAKEQARNKRTAGNRQTATQESFDKEFAAFEEKVRVNQEKAAELRGRIRVASGEEKATLKAQLDELNAEIKREYNKASMKYHPDRGGSNEWMGKFNEAYDGYKRGSYSSPSFSGATSSTRAKASAAGGGGGKTPPPRRGGAKSGGFKKPKGKATSSRVVDDLGVVVGKKRQKATARENITEFTKSIRTKIADSLAAFEDEARLKAKTDHQGMLDDYGAIDKTRRYRSIANKSIGERQVKWNGDEFENGKSLKDIYGGMDETTENEFEQYLLLRHAPDRIREGKPIFDLEHTNGKNYADPEVCAEEANKLLEKHPEFAERAEDLYRYIRNELQNRVDAGLLPKETAEEWAKKYPNYVPTGRVGTFTDEHDIWDLAGQLGKRGNTVGAGGIKSASGSDLDIRSIKEQLADATSRNWRDMTMNNLFKRQFGDKLKNAVALYDGDVEKALLDNTINLSKAKEGGKYFAEVYENGVPKRIEIEKRFYDAMEDLYKNGRFGNGIDVMTDAAAVVAHPFKQLVTSWNPIFMVKNGLRDFSEALINTRQTKEFLQSMPAAMRELTSGGEYLKAFRNSGVSQANLVNLEEALVKNEGFLRKAANRFATLQEMVETFPRLTEYMATLKKAGIDINDPDALKAASMTLRDRAAVNAADVTVNFGRSGSVGKMLNRGIVPFFNPSVQGWSKFIRNFSEQAGTKSLLGMLAKATALGAGVTALNNLMWGDNENYQQISARDKATNYIIPVPIQKDENGGLKSVSVDDANVFIKIPKSRFASAYSIPLVNLNNENKMGWAEMFTVAKDQIAPVDPLDSHLFAPFVLAAANKTWYGTPIESDYERENLNPSERYDENTSYIGRALGKATENLPKELQISPKKADYVVDAVSGVVGDFALPMLTPSKQGDGNAFNKYVGAPVSNVLKKSFTIDATTQNNLSSRFYDELGNAKMNANSANGGEAEKADYDRMTAYSTQISAVNKAMKAIQGGDSDTKQKDAYELRKVKNQLMQDALNGKDVPSSAKTMDAVQKYVGTTYAVENLGSSADKEAMKVYGASKYGNLSESEMKKRIDSDKEFYNGVRAIGGLEDKMSASGVNSSSALSKAVALASVNASDDLFSAYDTTEKNRTETASKMERAKAYFGNGGSEDEFIKLEKVRTSAGKLSDDDKDSELDDLDGKLARGEISDEEYRQRQDEINYNANISYLGLATSLAQANTPARGYALYDIKESNVRKGINLAAMGYSARDVRDMKKAADTDGNGYMKKQELVDFVANSGAEDKATLFDALYSYQGSNPFGAATNYSRALAAEAGRANGVESVDSDETDFKLNSDSKSKSGGGYYGRRRRRGYRRRSYSRRSSSGKKAATPELKIDAKAYKAEKQTYKSLAETLPKTSSRKAVSDYKVAKSNTAAAYNTKATTKKATVKAKPPTVKFKKYEV